METTLLDIQIPVEQIKAATAAIGEARKSLEALREEQKNLDKGSEAYTKNAIKIKELNAEIRTNERVVMANTKAQQANQGSIEQLRAQLSQVTDQWSKLSKEERENTDAGQKLVAQKLKLTEELKRLEKQTGDTRRNVGNYSEGVKEALMQSGLFSRQQQTLATVQKTVSTVTALATRSTNLFKVALASTGIGAIVIALGTLITYLTQTQKGMDIVKTATASLQAVFQVLIDRVLKFGEGIYKLFQQDFTGAIDSFKGAFKGIGQEIIQEATAAAELEQKIIDIEKAEANLQVTREKGRTQIKELNMIAEDTTKSDAERIAAAQKAIDIENDLLNQQLSLKREMLETIKAQNELGTSTEADLQKERDLQIEISRIERESLELKTTLNNKLNAITQQGVALREKAANDQAKADEEAKKKAEKEKEELEKRIAEELKMELEAAERLAQEKINIERQRLLDGEISVDTYNKRIANMEMEALEARKAVLEQFGQDTIDINSEILAAQVANAQAQIETDKIAEETKRDQKEKTLQMAISTLGEQTAAGKILSSAQAAINSYEAATLALATIPPPLGQIQAALTVIQGLAQVAKINAIPIPKFATGVIGIDGPGTGTSDSITAKISAGESVMTAKATAKYAPLLASLERSVGNNPNIGKVGKAKFANGVISAGINATRQAAQVDGIRSRELAVALKNQPIFVSLTELDTEQVRFNQARAVSVVE
jgi:hypothetical protein